MRRHGADTAFVSDNLRRLASAARRRLATTAGTGSGDTVLAPVEDEKHGQPVDLSRLRLPMQARHVELSLIASMDDSPGRPDTALMRTALDAIREATSVDLSHLHARSDEAARWLSVFPGEHYHLLTGLMRSRRPDVVVEVGTFTGLSALAMLEGLPQASRLVSFDVVPWDRLAGPALRAEDFDGTRLTQVLADLSDPDSFREHAALLASADVLFVDGPKDGRFEPAFWRLLAGLPRTTPGLVLFDDIRVWSMLDFWRRIDKPKIDLTSFGHWSGTGLLRLDPST